MNRANLSSSINPANRPRPSLVHQFLGSMSPRSRSVHHIASATTATRTSDEQPFNVLAPIKPRIMSCGREVDGIPCAYHVMVSFNDSGTAYVGYGFNIFARYVSNAITLKGYMHDALLVGTAHSLPFNNGLPFKELAFFGSGNKIFVPMVYGMEIAMIEEIAQHMSARWRVTGKQNEQLLASFHVVREHLAPYALHHGMIAIEFDNIPNNYNLNKDSGRFQDPVTLEQQPNALTCHMKSKSFELRDTDLPTNENTFIFNQTSFTYVLPLDSPATKVASRSAVDTSKLMMERNFTTTTDVEDLSDRFANNMHLSVHGSRRKSSATPASSFATPYVPKKANPISVTTAFRTPGVTSTNRSPTFGSRMSTRSRKASPRLDTRSVETPDKFRCNIVHVKGEGNCLPLSIAYYVYRSTADDKGDQVRKEVVAFIRKHIAFYSKKFGLRVNKLEKKLNKWEKPGVWLGEEFIFAAATRYDTQFTVFGHHEDNAHLPSYYNSQREESEQGNVVPLMNCIFFKDSHYSPVQFNLNMSNTGPSSEGTTTTSPPLQSTDGSAETEAPTSSQSSSSNGSEANADDDEEEDSDGKVETVYSFDTSDSETSSSSSDKSKSTKAPSTKAPSTKGESPSPTTADNNESSFFGMGFMNVLRRTPRAMAASVSSTAPPDVPVPALVSVSPPLGVIEDAGISPVTARRSCSARRSSTIQGATISFDDMGSGAVKDKSRRRSSKKSIMDEERIFVSHEPEPPTRTRVSKRANKGVKAKSSFN